MLGNKYIKTWHPFGWQHTRQQIRSHVRRSVLANMAFNMEFYLVIQAPDWKRVYGVHTICYHARHSIQFYVLKETR